MTSTTGNDVRKIGPADDVQESLENNISSNDTVEDQIRKFLIAILGNQLGEVKLIEGVIKIHHTGGDMCINLVHDTSQEDAHTETFDSVPLDLSPDSGHQSEILTTSMSAIESRVEEMPNDSETVDDKMVYELDDAASVGFLPKPEKIQTSLEKLDATLDEVVSNYRVKSSHELKEKKIDEYFRPQKPFKVMKAQLRKDDKLFGKSLSSKNFICNQCYAEFKALDLLSSHTMQTHGTYRCMECRKTFTQRSNLQRHSLIHLGFNPFDCRICDRGYHRKDHLVRHIEQHHPQVDPKSNTITRISSATCLEMITQCRKQGLNLKRISIESLHKDNSPLHGKLQELDTDDVEDLPDSMSSVDSLENNSEDMDVEVQRDHSEQHQLISSSQNLDDLTSPQPNDVEFVIMNGLKYVKPKNGDDPVLAIMPEPAPLE